MATAICVGPVSFDTRRFTLLKIAASCFKVVFPHKSITSFFFISKIISPARALSFWAPVIIILAPNSSISLSESAAKLSLGHLFGPQFPPVLMATTRSPSLIPLAFKRSPAYAMSLSLT